jgi:hypothetical protein
MNKVSAFYLMLPFSRDTLFASLGGINEKQASILHTYHVFNIVQLNVSDNDNEIALA